MLIAALVLNLVLLVPLVIALVAAGAGMDARFGPDSDARRIPACIYAAIAVGSAGLLALHGLAHPWAIPMTLALFAVQICYKLGTLVAVGLASPVAITIAVVVAVRVTAILSASRAGLFAA